MLRSNRISVVIPCFDDGRYLPETLDSLLAQTRAPDEVVVVDDGSTDPETLRILRRPIRGVRVIRQDNRGPGPARNTGIRQATGEFILTLDSDDLLRPRALEKMEGALAEDPRASFVYSQIECFGALEKVVVVPRLNPYVELRSNHGVVAALFRRSVFVEKGLEYPSMRGYEDWSFWLSCIEAGLSGAVVDEPLYRYRIKAGAGVNEAADRIRAELLEELARRHPALYSAPMQAALKSRHAPGLEIVWTGNETDLSRLREWVERQTFRDVVFARGGVQSARDLLAHGKGKYVVTIGASQLEALSRSGPGFLEALLRVAEARPEADAIALADLDVVFFRLARASGYTAVDLPPAAPAAAVGRKVASEGRIALLEGQAWLESGGAAPVPAEARAGSPSRIRQALVALIGEEKTARFVHPKKAALRDLSRRLTRLTRGPPLLRASVSAERQMLDGIDVAFPEKAPAR